MNIGATARTDGFGVKAEYIIEKTLYGRRDTMDNVAQSLVGKELIDISGILSEYGEPAYRARQLYQGLYRERAADLSRITTLPLEVRSRLAGQYCTGLPSVQEGIRSADGASTVLLVPPALSVPFSETARTPLTVLYQPNETAKRVIGHSLTATTSACSA